MLLFCQGVSWHINVSERVFQHCHQYHPGCYKALITGVLSCRGKSVGRRVFWQNDSTQTHIKIREKEHKSLTHMRAQGNTAVCLYTHRHKYVLMTHREDLDNLRGCVSILPNCFECDDCSKHGCVPPAQRNALTRTQMLDIYACNQIF